MSIINAEIVEAVNRRGAAKKAAFPIVTAVRYDRRIARIVISLDTRLDLSFSPRAAEGLENARPGDLDSFKSARRVLESTSPKSTRIFICRV